MIKSIMAKELYVDVEQLEDNIVLSEHPDVDSLVIPEILMALEDEGYIVPDESAIFKDLTIGEFIKKIEDLQSTK
ncbi:MAG: phosphopantetheine-binding protein [archaeon]